MLTSSSVSVPSPPRLAAIDLLRGLTIAFMILANNNGGDGAFWFLKHADWNGFTPTDLVFPTFLFLVGVAIPYSTASRAAHGESRSTLVGHIVRRSLVLFLLGIVVNSFPLFHLDTMRFYGVLQRIAICYLIVATFYVLDAGWRSKLALAVVALAGYWFAMRFVAVPGLGMPGREVPLLDPDRNLVAWLDRLIFSSAHLYEKTRDPEGLLSTLPALATAVLGLLSGLWLRGERSLSAKIRGIAVAGLACTLLGALWNFDFPINKKLWTSSFVLFAGGWSLLLLAAMLWLADARGAGTERSARPVWQQTLLVLGTNSIFAYMLSELLASLLWTIPVGDGRNAQQWIAAMLESAFPNATAAATVYSLLYLAVCWLPTWFLYRRRIFFKI